MDAPNLSNLSYLDIILHTRGIKELKKYFYNTLKYDPQQAIKLINADNLHFSALFALQNEFRDRDLSTYLNSRNKHAVELTNSILARASAEIYRMSANQKSTIQSVLKWMLMTGYIDDGLSNEFDEIIEGCAVLLVKEHNDISVLPVIADLIFSRYRKGLLIYDLVWAFFEARNPQSLVLIVRGLNSGHRKDIELSQKLLSFIPCVKSSAESASLYSSCLQWIKENYPFLNYTGESFQETPTPVPYVVSLEAKYLCKSVSSDSRDFLTQLNPYENQMLKQFNTLSPADQILLSDYSYWLYRQDLKYWNTWRNYPVLVQLNIVKNKTGGGWL